MFPTIRRQPRYAVGCALVALAVMSAGAAWAEPSPSYADLLGRLENTPASNEANATVEAAEARLRQAYARPNPTLNVQAENFAGSGPYSNFSKTDLGVSVSQNLELWGRRPARINAARGDAEVANRSRRLAILDAAGRLALVYAEAEAAERRAKLAEERLSLSLADARAALALVEQGREPLLRGIQAESEAASARAALDEAKAEMESAFARLTAVAMLTQPVTTVTDTLLDARATSDSSQTNAPTVDLAEAQMSAAERRIAIERVRTAPDLTATVGVTRFNDNQTAVTVGVSMPLPLFDRNKGNIDAAQAEFRAAEARVMQARQDAEADRAAAVARLAASTSRVSAADAGVASAQEAYRLSRLGAEAGRISQLELRVSRSALITASNAAVDARLARVRAEIDLARLEGRAPFQGTL